jgi:NDP-sugar pyrophosphorylase family protein
MKAMILAAGIGKRLQPLTNKLPKALITIGNAPILELVVQRLIKAGVNEIIINVFHFADMITDFLKSKNNFGIKIEISRENELLDTGGGLKKSSWFFDDGKPFFLHNVDVFTNLDLKKMYKFHLSSTPDECQPNVIATLAVKKRETKRNLMFDENGFLTGKESQNGKMELIKQVEKSILLGFCGIHVLSPEIFSKMTETGKFSIIDVYLRLAGLGEKIQMFRMDDFFFEDIGTLENLRKSMEKNSTRGVL